MQVGAVSLNNTSFGMSREDILNGIASLDEDEIRQLAKAKTYEDINSKKHRRVNNALTLSIPVAGGVAAAATIKASRLGRIAGFAGGFGSWALPLLAGYGVVKGANAIIQNSDGAYNFQRKHPILSNIGLVTAAYAGFRGMEKFGDYLKSKYGSQVLEKFSPQILKFSDKLDKSAILNKASKLVKSIHPAMKEVTKTGLKIAPWALILTGFVHWLRYSMVKANLYIDNYHQIKTVQAQVHDYLDAKAKEA